MRAAKMRVVIDYAYGNTSIILPHILGNLGVEMIALNAYFDSAKVREFGANRGRHLEQLANVTTSLGAELGILIDQTARRSRSSTIAAASSKVAGCSRC